MIADTTITDGAIGLLSAAKRSKAISLTPLIDVVFILLMFFMLTTSFIKERQIELSSPVASANQALNAPQLLWLDRLGSLRLESPKSQLLVDKVILTRIDSDQPVVIRPAADADIQGIVSTLARLKGLGIEELSLGRPYGATE
tara:strand:+ start:135332 stop:135760 length:429 start_codon:yes stop_codon:yes gene_type:complete